MKVLAPPLDRISADAREYPVHLLREGNTGLCLFAAAFLGVNDAIHMARMNMTVTCVDTNWERLDEMSRVYPSDWSWNSSDAWVFAQCSRHLGEQWDVVSVDTFTGDATDRSMKTLDLWCSLARRVVTVTRARGQEFVVPEGWEFAGSFERSLIADWLVLTRA